MKIYKTAFLAIWVILNSCSTMQGSYHYTMGTQCLNKGDLGGAFTHFTQACELDPSTASYHNNLAFTYLQLGEVDKAWYHLRQAAFLDPDDAEVVSNFYMVAEHLEEKYQIGNGLSKEGIEKCLGVPDEHMTHNDYAVLRYGILFFVFKDNQLEERCDLEDIPTFISPYCK
jgi:tetratricopeptide (TPR) repeat protein